MRFVTFEIGGTLHPGVLRSDNAVLDLSTEGFSSLIEMIQMGEPGLALARKALEATEERQSSYALDQVKLCAPIPEPRKLICIGLNYLDHAKETDSEIPKVPTVFNKFASTVIGPGDAVVLPRVSNSVDYEAELAFIIGKGGRHIPAAEWKDHIFGYTIVNDISARDYQRASSQWLMGKTFDTFAPIGPWIVTSDEIADPHTLDISMTIGGEVLQNSNTRELIFKIPDLIAFLSSVFTLAPGDIVSTGTPSGVGVARNPQRFLKPGEQMTISVSGIGELHNTTVAEK